MATKSRLLPVPEIQQRPLSGREYEWLADYARDYHGERLELWDGVLVGEAGAGYDAEPPRHDFMIARVAETLIKGVASAYAVRPNGRLYLDEDRFVVPDFAIVAAPLTPGHPRGAHAIVEVTYTSTIRDLQEKPRIYADLGVSEYWSVDLILDAVHVHRDPVADRYRRITTHRAPEVLHLAGATLDLAVLLST
jgi:Uma2 family endonuclease